MDARNRAFVVHLTPHRIRIKIPQWERQDAYFAPRALERHPGVVCVHVSSLVASVVIHCRDGFAITSMRHCFAGLELVLPPRGSPASRWARQIAPAQRFRNGSESSICLVGLIVKLTFAIATRRLEAVTAELILEAAAQVLLRQLSRKATQLPRLEAARLVAAAA